MRIVQARFIRTRDVAVALGAMLAMGSFALAAPKEASPRKDQHFITEAIQGDLSEVRMGKLAEQKGQSDAVRQFGRTLQQDHSEHLRQAEQMAQQTGLSAPSQPTAQQKAAYRRMDSTSRTSFDAAFARAMVRDHEEDIKKYEQAATSDSHLADFAKETLPVLRKHLEMAQSLLPSSRGR